jgi:hypothetical protein
MRDNIKGITFKEVIDRQGRVKGKREIEIKFGIGMTWVEYFRLRTMVQRRVDGRHDTGEPGQNIQVMMNRGKLKSSKLRKKVVGRNSVIYNNNDPRRMMSLWSLWGQRLDPKERKFVELNLAV